MQKKLSITIDEEVYNGSTRFRPRPISRFFEDLRPHVLHPDVEAAMRKWPVKRSVSR